jgi:hypothetical protein
LVGEWKVAGIHQICGYHQEIDDDEYPFYGFVVDVVFL